MTAVVKVDDNQYVIINEVLYHFVELKNGDVEQLVAVTEMKQDHYYAVKKALGVYYDKELLEEWLLGIDLYDVINEDVQNLIREADKPSTNDGTERASRAE